MCIVCAHFFPNFSFRTFDRQKKIHKICSTLKLDSQFDCIKLNRIVIEYVCVCLSLSWAHRFGSISRYVSCRRCAIVVRAPPKTAFIPFCIVQVVKRCDQMNHSELNSMFFARSLSLCVFYSILSVCRLNYILLL